MGTKRSAHVARLVLAIAVALAATGAAAQPQITSPKEHLGANIGDDYFLATYSQLVTYWQKLASESDRMTVVDIGKTAEGRQMIMAIITSAENHQRLDRYKQIARQLALAEGLTDDQARALAAEGKAVVWIDGGLHADEVVGAQTLVEMAYEMVSRNDTETLRFLNYVVLLLVPVNPDGMELVGNWYMREAEPSKRSMAGLPTLYQKYIGHDNNRDFYMVSQPETEAASRVMYWDWFPQIVYNHHQSGPPGTVLFAPPFRDPFNYQFDPLVPVGIDLVAAAMHNRFIAENKPGATMRSGAPYSTWFNGGLRTATYFHNMIGLLTEIIGSPTPEEIPFVLERQLPTGDQPFPIQPQTWHLRQSIEYSITANRAVVDIASRLHEQLLFNFYRMGKNSIERGNRDSWTITPKRIAAVQAAMAKEERPLPKIPGLEGLVAMMGSLPASPKYYPMLHDPALRDPRGFIIPSDQPDFLTATKFVNALIKSGITIHRATGQFEVGGKRYPAGSYVVKTAQAFRPHIMDMFEPQDYPNDFIYPGGPPKPPYDATGWTLAFQMGVQFDRILDGFDGPFEKISGFAQPPARAIALAPKPVGVLLSTQVNDSFLAINRLLAAKEDVYRFTSPLEANGRTYPPGTIYVPLKQTTLPLVQRLAEQMGLPVEPLARKPTGQTVKLRPVRLGLWDRYGGSMDSGWIRWLLEQFEFPFEVVYPPMLDAGNLNQKFDVLICPGGAIPARAGSGAFSITSVLSHVETLPPELRAMIPDSFLPPPPERVPAQFRDRMGRITADKTIPQLRAFVDAGGTLLAIGSSTAVAAHFDLPLANHLTERTPAGGEKPLAQDKYYVPGSVLQIAVDNTDPVAWGLPERVDVFFDNDPVWRLNPDAALKGVRAVGWFASAEPLRSGWAWGQGYLQGGVAVAEAGLGKGKVVLFSPEITFRSQPHGTYKLLFNAIDNARAMAATLP